jgi:predicted nucleic acid-binding protein
MKFALDTNIISFALRLQHGIKERMYEAAARGDTLVIPPVTYFEIIRGLLADHAEVKLRLFYAICNGLVYMEMEQADWLEAARLYADCRKRGRPTSDADILQAAFCIHHDCTLVTNNTADFDHFTGLRFIDWVQGS